MANPCAPLLLPFQTFCPGSVSLYGPDLANCSSLTGKRVRFSLRKPLKTLNLRGNARGPLTASFALWQEHPQLTGLANNLRRAVLV